jgi:TorA maturation chaperone TorD
MGEASVETMPDVGSAQSDAEQAQSANDQAQPTAGSALTDADQAQPAANQARPVADQSQFDADQIQALVSLNQNRALFYRELAYYYLHELTQEQIERIAATDFDGLDGGDEDIAEGYREMKAYLCKLTTGTRQQLASDYAHTFLAAGNYETFAATPYESVFTSEEGLMMQDARDEVYKMYCAEHMQPDESLRIPEDHLSFEFQFLALLLDRLNEALTGQDWQRASSYAHTIEKFHTEHQLNWIDDFCDTVEDVALTTFYSGVSKVTRGFIHSETAVIQDEAEMCDELASDKEVA